MSDLLHGGSEARGVFMSSQSGMLGCWVGRGHMSSPSSPLCSVPVHSTRLLLHCCSAINFDGTFWLRCTPCSRKTPPVQSVPVDSATCWAPLLPRSSPYLFCPSGFLSLLCLVGLEALSLEPGLPAVRKHCYPFSHPQRPFSDKQIMTLYWK